MKQLPPITLSMVLCAYLSLSSAVAPAFPEETILHGSVSEKVLKPALGQYAPWGFRCGRIGTTELPATVTQVDSGSLAERRGIKIGDRILSVNATEHGITLGIERGGKKYSAEIDVPGLSGGTSEITLKGGAAKQGLETGTSETALAGGVQTQKLEATIDKTPQEIFARQFERPLRIHIATGGSFFTNSFNGRGATHELLMQLADLFADQINQAQLGPGAMNVEVIVRKPRTQMKDESTQNFFSDCNASIHHAGASPIKKSYAASMNKQGITLAPCIMNVEFGGSHFDDSFNNGAGPSILDVAKVAHNREILKRDIPYEKPGPLAEQPTANLRPTFLEIEFGGSRGENCFEKTESAVDPIGIGKVEVVPSKSIVGWVRSVDVHLEYGGSHFVNSFNKDGSLTIQINEFLDRLQKKVKPSDLAAVQLLYFSMEGTHVTDSFDH